MFGGLNMQILKRDNTFEDFNIKKIKNAITKAMSETEVGIDMEVVNKIATSIEQKYSLLGVVPTVEQIQDNVEQSLAENGRFDVAKTYILYRNERSKFRKSKQNSNELLTDEFISKYKHAVEPMNQLGSFVFYRTYSRWIPELNRREYWYETVRRAVEYNCSLAPTTREEAEKLYDNVFNLKQFLSGRTLFTGGTDVSKKYGMSNFNCSYTTVNDFEAFKDLLYLLLIGAGVGLGVRKNDVDKLPKVRGDIKVISKAYFPVKKKDRIEYTGVQFEDDIAEIIVGDSKEGWVQALEIFLKFFYLREYSKVNTIIMNYDNVRPAGERLKTFGGYASGYKPFMTMIEKIYSILIKDNSYTKKLKPIDCMDIGNIIGMAVVSGGVRRTSEVILFDYDDKDILESKSNLYNQDKDGKWTIDESIAHRRMSNNSIQYESKPSREQWHKHISEMRFSGEPAFQNLEASKKRKSDVEGGNPLT